MIEQNTRRQLITSENKKQKIMVSKNQKIIVGHKNSRNDAGVINSRDGCPRPCCKYQL